MRKPLIAGNWKMHGTVREVQALVTGIKKETATFSRIEVAVFPSLIHLQEVRDLLSSSSIHFGAQNLYLGDQGAFTGEVSGSMLHNIGCQYVLIGHSERRTLFREDLSLIAQKFKAAVASNLKPVLCVGETKSERESQQTERIIREQIKSVIDHAGIEAFGEAVIAYEPVWAIGTGLTATPLQAQEMHAFIRQIISQNKVDLAKTIRILYGGSMKADNALELLSMPDIDGGLIGGASLKAESFVAICQAAEKAKYAENTKQ